MAFKIKVNNTTEKRLLTDGSNGIKLSEDNDNINKLTMTGEICANKFMAGSNIVIDGDSDSVEAKLFKGDLTGNASTATKAENAETASSAVKATQDASGNTITSYYLPKANATSKGSATQPVYFNSSGVATETTYQLNATVPSEAVFTDTKNTAGGTQSERKLFLVGMMSQSDENMTYTNSSVYMNGGTVTAASYNATSDARLKENLREYEPKGSILDLPIYEYDFIDGPKDQIGCLAQDLRRICPELVAEGDDGYLSIKESKIVYLLLKEVSRLKDEVDRLGAMRG